MSESSNSTISEEHQPKSDAIPEAASNEPVKAGHGDDEYPSPMKRVTIMASLYLALFLVTLDQNIITTALPRITDEFNSISDIGWYGSAYLLSSSSFQLLMGRVYKFYPAKYIFLGCCGIFEIGSAVCGAAPSSTAFIIGRAIAGLGCSGLFGGVMVIMFNTIPLRQRPIWQGLFGAVFAVGSVVGPLVGGAFTDSSATWRWCFYINLPIGAVSMVVTLFLSRVEQKLDVRAPTLLGQIQQLDPIGTLVFFPGIICLILALQWGGTKYSWDNARIIVLLILCGVLCIAFIVVQAWKGEAAMVPPRTFKQRSIAAAVFFGFFQMSGGMVLLYYLPIWFQAIKDVSAVKSGIMLLPLVLSTVVGALGSGILTSKLGYYTPFFWLSSILMPVGAGLMTTFTPYTGHAKWIGYQVLLGIGFGAGSQQAMNVVQTVLERSDIAIGSAIVMFVRFLGSAIFLPVGENIFLNTLVKNLRDLPGINPGDVTQAGATKLRQYASGDDLATLLWNYNDAVVNVFYMVTATAAVTIFGTIFVEWKSLKARVRASNKEAQRWSGQKKRCEEHLCLYISEISARNNNCLICMKNG